jgi:hypothetical protein
MDRSHRSVNFAGSLSRARHHTEQIPLNDAKRNLTECYPDYIQEHLRTIAVCLSLSTQGARSTTISNSKQVTFFILYIRFPQYASLVFVYNLSL